jgi:hypothetical protein
MKIITETLAANETKGFSFVGEYLEVLQADNPITVKFRGMATGFGSEEMENVLSGMFERPKGAYSGFTVTNGAVAQTIKLFVGMGDGGSRRQPGTVNVSGVVETRDGGTAYGAVYSADGATGASHLTTVILPAANVNGVLIHAATQYSSDAASNGLSTLLAKASAPAGLMDGDVLDFQQAPTSVGGVYFTTRKLLSAVRVPSGRGIYIFNLIAQANNMRNVVYTIL